MYPHAHPALRAAEIHPNVLTSSLLINIAAAWGPVWDTSCGRLRLVAPTSSLSCRQVAFELRRERVRGILEFGIARFSDLALFLCLITSTPRSAARLRTVAALAMDSRHASSPAPFADRHRKCKVGFMDGPTHVLFMIGAFTNAWRRAWSSWCSRSSRRAASSTPNLALRARASRQWSREAGDRCPSRCRYCGTRSSDL